MVLNYQRWTPPCGCSFEEEVNSETKEVKLLFSHTICGGHEDIAKNTPIAAPQATIDKQKDDIIKAKRKAWDLNKTRHLSDFDNHEQNKIIKAKVNKVGINKLNEDPNTEKLYQHYLSKRKLEENSVDSTTNDREIDMLIGLESPYALTGTKVYEQIVTENQTTQDSTTETEGG